MKARQVFKAVPLKPLRHFVSVAEELRIARQAIFGKSFQDLSRIESNWVRNQIITGITTERNQSATINRISTRTGWSKQKASAVVRNEEHAIRGSLLDASYKITNPEGEDKYKWIGPAFQKGRSTLICVAIKRRTQNGVNLKKLKQIIKEEADKKIYDSNRPFVAHIGERHRAVRIVG